MKKSIVNFIIGVLVGAIMATAGIYAYIELSQNNSEPSSSMEQPPQMQNGDNSQPPQSQGDNNLQQPPEKPDGDNSNADNGNARIQIFVRSRKRDLQAESCRKACKLLHRVLNMNIVSVSVGKALLNKMTAV